MSLFLLQTAANQALTNVLNSMINSSATQVKDAFAPVLAQMQTYSYGLAATGLLAGMLPLVLGYMFSGQFSYETLFKYLLMAGLFVNYPTLIRLADDVFKQPGEQLENTLKAQSNDGIDLVNAYVTAYTDAVNQYYDNKDAQVSSLDLGARLDIAIDRALKHIGIYI
ncbi:MAG TPA: hypothetical protein VN616_18470, partial [Puia sp.]|nr:hypothetical protein [Puia sp.]